MTLLLAFGLLSYGVRLNQLDESHIADRMKSQAVPLLGARATTGMLQPIVVLDTVKLYSNEMTDAIALIDGRIDAAYVSKNSNVRRGDVIFNLVNEKLPMQIRQADSAIAKAQALHAQAIESYQRYQKLMSMEATSRERFEQSLTELRSAEAVLDEVYAQKEELLVQDARQHVTAPIDGEILIIYKQPGAYVAAGTPLALIGKFDRLDFSVPMEDKIAKQFTVGQTVEMRFQRRDLQKAYDTEYSSGNVGANEIFSATVKEIMPSLEEPALMRKMLFEIDNSAGLLEPQTYGGVVIRSTKMKKCLTIPLSALINVDNGETAEVFIVEPDNTLAVKKIKIGADDGTRIEVRDGLQLKTVVITSNPKGLVAGMKVDVTIGGDPNG